jgi:hypothetical protein
MKPFTTLAQIEQFAETPENKVVGRFSCLLVDIRRYGCYSADYVIWRMSHDPNSGRHPWAVARHFEKGVN